MVNEKSKHLLAEVYRGRLDGDIGDTAAFSDVYTMKRMSKENPGKMASATAAPAPFEFVSESNMDFENYKNRPEFSDEHGGEGSVYGGAASSIHRPDTPSSHWGGKDRGRSASRDSERTFGGAGPDEPGVLYPAGYHQTPSALREYSPSPERGMLHRLDSTESPYEIHDDDGGISCMVPRPWALPPRLLPVVPLSRRHRVDSIRRTVLVGMGHSRGIILRGEDIVKIIDGDCRGGFGSSRHSIDIP